MTGIQTGNRGSAPFARFHRAGLHQAPKFVGMGIHPLAQGLRRWNLLDAHGLLEIFVPHPVGYRLNEGGFLFTKNGEQKIKSWTGLDKMKFDKKMGSRSNRKPIGITGANEESRTPDLLITNQLLYRLSYVGVISCRITISFVF